MNYPIISAIEIRRALFSIFGIKRLGESRTLQANRYEPAAGSATGGGHILCVSFYSSRMQRRKP